MTIVVFIAVLAVLIFVHELGHFLAAKLFGIRVDAFKLGFGPKVAAWRWKKKDPISGQAVVGETEYGVNWLPFGGYVKIFGENPDDQSLDAAGPEASRSFVLKPRWKQAAVLSAGVLFNFIFAWFLYAAVFASGVTASTAGFERYAAHFSDPRIMITFVEPDSPAEKAGLLQGDVLTAVGSTNAILPPGAASSDAPDAVIASIQNTVNASAGKPVTVDYTRAGKAASVEIVPAAGIVPGRYAVGISMDRVVNMRLPFFAAVWEGLHYTGVLIKETAAGIYSFVADIFVGHPDFSQVAGPVGIAGIVGNAAALGLKYLVMATAVISINLGVINLIPFPALDGGRILFVAVESVVRRRIPAKFTNAVNMAGFALLVLLMIAVTYKDVAKLISG